MTQKQIEKAIKAMCKALNYTPENKQGLDGEIYADLVNAGAIEEPVQEEAPVQVEAQVQEETEQN